MRREMVESNVEFDQTLVEVQLLRFGSCTRSLSLHLNMTPTHQQQKSTVSSVQILLSKDMHTLMSAMVGKRALDEIYQLHILLPAPAISSP